MHRPELQRLVWGEWYHKEFGANGSTAEWLKYLYPQLSPLDIIKYSHAWHVKDHYPPWIEYFAFVLRDAPTAALEDYANPEAEICNGGSSPIPYVLELVQRELADRILTSIRGIDENVSNAI